MCQTRISKMIMDFNAVRSLKHSRDQIYMYSKVQKSLPSVFQLFISKEMMNKKIKYIQR